MEMHAFHVRGMHCAACVALIESELRGAPGVSRVRASLAGKRVEVAGEFGGRDAFAVARDYTNLLAPHGYVLSLEAARHETAWSEFRIAAPVAVGFAAFFVLLQKLGIVNLVGDGTVTYGSAFVIGVVASLSTCMAVVGGLLLSMSATYAKGGDAVWPQTFFHGGRLVAFFVLGGAIGAIGLAFQLGATGLLAVSVIVGVLMLVLGLNLLDVFPWMKRFTLTLPAALGRRVHGLRQANHELTPALVGVATFFLPCGFTQSMQLYTLSTGSFLTGGLTMLAFALGTLPVLAFVSFSSFRMKDSPHAGVFWKSAGLIVILFALFNILAGLAAAGWIAPVFLF